MKEVLTEEVQLVTREEEYMISTTNYVKFLVLWKFHPSFLLRLHVCRYLKEQPKILENNLEQCKNVRKKMDLMRRLVQTVKVKIEFLLIVGVWFYYFCFLFLFVLVGKWNGGNFTSTSQPSMCSKESLVWRWRGSVARSERQPQGAIVGQYPSNPSQSRASRGVHTGLKMQ